VGRISITVAVSPSGAVIGALAPNLLNARIFECNGNEFLQKGTDISGFSHSMSLNYDGSIVVVGSNERVGVFKWNDTLWELIGDYVSSYSGLGDRGCVSITNDGMTVIGTRSGNGRVGVYNWNGNSWAQKATISWDQEEIQIFLPMAIFSLLGMMEVMVMCIPFNGMEVIMYYSVKLFKAKEEISDILYLYLLMLLHSQ